MFRKRVSLGSQSLISSKDRKTLLSALQTLFPSPLWAEVLGRFPAIEVCKISGSKGRLYTVKEEDRQVPIFIDRNGKGELFPSLFLLWRAPETVRAVEIWSGVSRFLLNGADLMWPGVCEPLSLAGVFPSSSYLAIKVRGNPQPIAIGRVIDCGSALSADRIAGKFIEVLHVYRDELWAMQPTVPNEGFGFESVSSLLPERPEEEKGTAAYDQDFPPLPQSSTEEKNQEQTTTTDPTPADTATVAENLTTAETIPVTDIPVSSETRVDAGPEPAAEETKEPQQEVPPVPVLTPAQYDDNIRLCFLTTLKLAIQPSDLPLEPSRLLSLMPLCKPKDMPVDLKRSTYKKIGTFLKAMQKAGFVTYAKVKGIDHDLITEIHQNQAELAAFQPIVRQMGKPKVAEEIEETTAYPKVRYTHVLKPTKTLRRFFSGVDIAGIAVTREEAQKVLRDYIAQKELENGVSSKKWIRANEDIAEFVGAKAGEEVEKSAVYTKFLGKFEDGFVREDLTGMFPPEVKSGPIPKLTLTLSAKFHSHKATIIEGLEQYNIPPASLMHNLQQLLATSGFLQPQPSDESKVHVHIMGVKHKDSIINVLTEYYKVPAGCIEVKDFIKPKGGKK